MTRITSSLAIVSIVLLAGCTADSGQNPTPAATGNTPASAHATLMATSGSQVSGTLTFASTDQGVRITGKISGLKPDSTHGFHIHANGNCQAPDASSAGGHFNLMQSRTAIPAAAPTTLVTFPTSKPMPTALPRWMSWYRASNLVPEVKPMCWDAPSSCTHNRTTTPASLPVPPVRVLPAA